MICAVILQILQLKFQMSNRIIAASLHLNKGDTVMRHLFLVNPAAGKADCTSAIQDIAQSISQAHGDPCSIQISNAPGDITRLANDAGASGEETRLYACGGDGTLNEAAAGARGYDNLSLTCIPMGSGNDFVRYFPGRDLFYHPENFSEVSERRIDLMDVNGRCCIGICSAGFDARIGTDINAYRRHPLLGGSRAYTASIVINFLKGIVKPCQIELADGTLIDEDLTLCCICNASWYGGGYNPVPEADMTDGLLDVLAVKKVSRLTVARVISAYQKGLYQDYPELISHYRTNRLHITTPAKEPVNIDGELLITDDFYVELQPKALRFFAPKGVWESKDDCPESGLLSHL